MDEVVEHIKKLYENGEFCETLKGIAIAWNDINVAPREIKIIKAWSCYRTKNYECAAETALILGEDDVEALKILATLAGYATKNNDLLLNIYNRLPHDTGVCNAVAIGGRDKNSQFSLEEIKNLAEKAENKQVIAYAHLLNNIGRALLARGNKDKDLVSALRFFREAMLRYGKGNYHHRAALHFWISEAAEEMGNKPLAIISAKKSLQLWVKQLSLDPENPKFRENFEGAKKRLSELLS